MPSSRPELFSKQSVRAGASRSKPTQHQQLKHALSVNAAHVLTNDYMMLSQPLSEVAPHHSALRCACPASVLLPPHHCLRWRCDRASC